MVKTVAIIGAGCSGLTAIKCCLDEGLTPVCFERTADIGGLWYFTKTVRDDQACVMKSTVINTSKEMMCYSDFPIPKEYANYMHNTKVLEYFNLYVDNFKLRQYIQFKTSVRSVRKADDFEKTGKWNLEIEDESGEKRTECYDAILVCTGHHASKNVPEFPGMDDFQGEIVHSHDYKDQTGYEDKRIVVVGIGNSGADAVVELGRVGQVFLSTRRGAWVINRVAKNGIPGDMIQTRRVNLSMFSRLPKRFVNWMITSGLNKRFDHTLYGMKPDHDFFAQHPTVNDDLPNRIICGAVVVKPNIKRFTKTGVEFEDGSFEDNIDLVLFCTGYKFGFPFIDKSVIDVKDNVVRLYKYVFPPDLTPSTLAVIGCFQPLGALMPLSEQQCRWATRVFKGLNTLPCPALMNADVTAKRKALKARYVQTPRHTIQVDWIPFMDEITEQFGAKPDIWQLIKEDPRLGLECFFGPCTPYQYRLMGPGKWDGARDAIMTQWERTYFPFRTRSVRANNDLTSQPFFIFAVVIIAFLSWLCYAQLSQ